MEVKVTSEKQNPMLKRKEINFQVEHEQTGSTPTRVEIRKAIAAATKTDESVVFVKKFETKTGTHTALGIANIYDTVEQAKLIEPEYIVKRNIPEEKTKEDKETKEAKETKEPKQAKEAKETKEVKEAKETKEEKK
jgi:small subunit ribosomal protein S24e